MTAISATLVKELRELTGAGIMDAKRALQDTGGDVDAAKKLLREKGMASADKRAGRATTEGKVGYRIHEDGSRGTIVGLGCETEPVSNNDEFLAFAKKVLEVVDEEGVGAEAKLYGPRMNVVKAYAAENRLNRIAVVNRGEPAMRLTSYVAEVKRALLAKYSASGHGIVTTVESLPPEVVMGDVVLLGSVQPPRRACDPHVGRRWSAGGHLLGQVGQGAGRF